MAAAVEIEHGDVGDLVRSVPLLEQKVADREVAVQEAGVVHAAGVARHRRDRRRGRDSGKALAVGAGVPGAQQVAQLEAPLETGGDEDPGRVAGDRLGEEERLGGREPRRREGRRHAEALRRFRLAARSQQPGAEAALPELLDRHRGLAHGGRQSGAVDVVTPPVERRGGHCGIEQTKGGGRQILARQVRRRLAAEARPGEGDRSHTSRISKLVGAQ